MNTPAAILLTTVGQPSAHEQAITIMPDDAQLRKTHEEWGFSQTIEVSRLIPDYGITEIGVIADLAARTRGDAFRRGNPI